MSHMELDIICLGKQRIVGVSAGTRIELCSKPRKVSSRERTLSAFLRTQGGKRRTTLAVQYLFQRVLRYGQVTPA